MYRAQHTRFVGHNSIVLTHAVDMGGNRSAVRWYELRDAHDGNWSVHQSGTWDPDGTSSRWMSSAAMDAYGNIGMAYSVCDATSVYAGLRYTGRLSTDPLGQMTFAEESAIEGTGSQTVTDRFGDYGHMSLDPDGGTFWHTGEYLGTNGGRRVRVFSFMLDDVAGMDNPYYTELAMLLTQTDGIINMTIEGIHGNEEVQADLIGLDGRVIETVDLTPTNGETAHSFNASGLGNGIYFVRVGNQNFQEAERVLIAH